MCSKINLTGILAAAGITALFPLTVLGAKFFPDISSAAAKFGNTEIGYNLKEYIPTDESQSSEAVNPVSEGFGSDYEISVDNQTDSQTDFSPSENAGEKPYPTIWNENSAGNVIKNTYGSFSGTTYFNLSKCGQVQNKTSLGNDVLVAESMQLPEFNVDLSSDEPQVLIMHTHTTETYEPFERENYDTSFNYRTTDSKYNMVMVGNAIQEELEKAGISVIHSDNIHDYPSYNGSYERSAETVKEILEQYPSIKVVLDIHRDAISDGDNILQPVVRSGEEEAAQVMIISGCDDGTMGMPNYMQNFRFACLLQTQMETDHEGFTRPILFDYRKYNQDLTTGSILIEVGSHGNTLEQAETAGEWIGESLAKCLKSLDKSGE